MGGVDGHFTATVITVDPQWRSFALIVTYLAVTLTSLGDVSSLTATTFAKKTTKKQKNQSNKQKNKKQSTIKSSQIHILKWQKLKILSLWNGRSFKIIFALGSCCQSLITRGSVSTGYPHAFECNLVWIGRSKFSEQTKLHESERRQKSKQVKFWQHALSYFTQLI